jgi:hypothetical protein
VLIAELRPYLSERLPEYMIPSAYVMLSAMPLNSSGKVDRRALPAPQSGAGSPIAIYVAPQNELEQIIATIWQECLSRDQVGVDDNFFDLGGHSLLIIQAHTKLCETLGREIAIVELFRHSTIRALASHLAIGEPVGAAQHNDARAERLTEGKNRLKQWQRKQRAVETGRGSV